jgi:hypothetical protein
MIGALASGLLYLSHPALGARFSTSGWCQNLTHALQQTHASQQIRRDYAVRSTRMSISLGSVPIVFVSPPTRAWWVMATPFGSLRNGDDHKTLAHEFSSERGDRPPLRAQP